MNKVTKATFYFTDKTSATIEGESATELHGTFVNGQIRPDSIINFGNQTVFLRNVIRIEWF